MAKKQKKLVVIDSNALLHRAWHIMPPLTTSDGTMVNAVYGYTSLLLKIIKELKPDYMIASFDLAGKTFRHEQYEDYKAHRVKQEDEFYEQFPIAKDVLATFNEENSLSLFGDMIPPLFLIIAYIIGIFDPNISSAFLDDLSQAPILHPIALAGFIGLFITGINLMPAGQLDGGHISRATFGRKHHRYISYFAIMIMLFLDLWLFALLVFFTMPRKETPIALNDVSELSSSRRVLGAVFFFIGILCLPWPTYILEYII